MDVWHYSKLAQLNFCFDVLPLFLGLRKMSWAESERRLRTRRMERNSNISKTTISGSKEWRERVKPSRRETFCRLTW